MSNGSSHFRYALGNSLYRHIKGRKLNLGGAAPDLQGNNLKVDGKPRILCHTWAITPNHWKQEGTQSSEKRRVTKDLCGIALPQKP
jgi:hypothetical protein